MMSRTTATGDKGKRWLKEVKCGAPELKFWVAGRDVIGHKMQHNSCQKATR